jgi:hypothetical protein
MSHACSCPSTLPRRSAEDRAAGPAPGPGACFHRPDLLRRQRHCRPPRHRHLCRGQHRHGAAVAADAGADRHPDLAHRLGVAAQWRRPPRAHRPAVPAGPVAVAPAVGRHVRVPQRGAGAAAGLRHRAGHRPRGHRIPACDPLGRAGADPVFLHALPQRGHALDAADDGAGLWRAAGAGAAGLGADQWPCRLPGNGGHRPGHRLGGDDVAAGRRLRALPGAYQALCQPAVVRPFRWPGRPRHRRPAAYRPADRHHRADGRRAVHRHRAADRSHRCHRGGRAPDRDQRGAAVFHDPDGRGRGDHGAGRPCGRPPGRTGRAPCGLGGRGDRAGHPAAVDHRAAARPQRRGAAVHR